MEKYYIPKDPLSLDLAGGDALLLGLTSILYFVLVFVIEKLKNVQSVSRIMDA